MVRPSYALIGVLLSLLPPSIRASTAKADPANNRAAVIARAQVWQPTDIAAMNVKVGPTAPKGFAPGETITCTHANEKLGGRTPKFACRTDAGDQLKVKYGGTNGEVYAEVLSSRLLWALGFGADHMYPVRVVCRNCPSELNGVERSRRESVFDPAAVERKMPGESFRPDDGWSWKELDLVDEQAGGATRAQLDALRLLAVFIQHTDTKPEQQRLVCLGEPKSDRNGKGPIPCTHPFMLIQDLGVTFGRANKYNDDTTGSVNLAEWTKTPVWKSDASCIGNLPKSATGTLDDPPIGEAGRRFLADLLAQLTDSQLHDLFDAARVTLRLRDPHDLSSGFPTVDEWVAAFKDKRRQIAEHHCAT